MMSPGTATLFNAKSIQAAALIFCALSLLASVAFITNPFSEQSYYGHKINVPAPAFNLINLQEQQVFLKDYQGQYIYLMFGYLNCTQTCHSQALVLDNLSNHIKDNDVHFIYISMDPERDNIEKLKFYFKTKNHKLSILSGENVKQIQAIANKFNAPFSITPTNDNYEISHPGFIFLINPEGQLSMVYSGKMLDTDKLYEDLLKFKSRLS